MEEGIRPGLPQTPARDGAFAADAPMGLGRPTRVRFLVLGLACGLSFLLYLHRYSWGFVKKDIAEEFHWGPVTMGWLDSLFLATYALMQVPSGVLSDWFGTRLLLAGSVLVWSLALAAVVGARGFVAMAAARLVFGVGQAACYPALGKVSKNWFPLGMRTTAQSLIATLSGRGGGAVSFLLFGSVFLSLLGLTWREAIVLLSCVGIGCGVLFVALFRNLPAEHPWANRAEAELITKADPEAAHARRSRLSWRGLVRSRSVLLLLVRAMASNMADVLYVYWLPLYLLRVHRLDVKSIAWMAALPLLGGAVGGVFSGFLQSYLIRRTGGRRWARSGVGMAGKGIAAALMLGALTLEDAYAIAFVFLAVKFFADWEQPAEWGTATDLGGRSAATLFACINTAGALGGFLSGPLIGLVLQSPDRADTIADTGWKTLFLLIAIEYIIAAVCWLGIDCRKTLRPIEDKG